MTVITKNSNWLAQLKLKYKTTERKTLLSFRRHLGPLVVQKSFYPEKSVCHTYLIHPPGGIVGGDRIELDVELEKNSQVLITTPAATKFYLSKGPESKLIQNFTLANDACLEWLPQESIVFNGANINQQSNIYLAETSQLFFWEMVCLGRTASDEVFERGEYKQSIQIYREKKLIFIERNKLSSNQGLYEALIGFQGNPVFGTFIITPVKTTEYKLLLEEISGLTAEGKLFSYTLKGSELVCRFLGADIRHVQQLFRQVWSIIRPHVTNCTACEPRIWHT